MGSNGGDGEGKGLGILDLLGLLDFLGFLGLLGFLDLLDLLDFLGLLALIYTVDITKTRGKDALRQHLLGRLDDEVLMLIEQPHLVGELQRLL